MRVAIIGGKLQGVEAAYLASKAGWETVLLDRSGTAPAAGLCKEIVQVDLSESERVKTILDGVDLVIPAFENREGLAMLERISNEIDTPVAFDFAANTLSSSKARSHGLFQELGLDMPKAYPECGFPLLVKPDHSSGSEGVTILDDEDACVSFFGQNTIPEGWVGQQFVDGPSFSLEVIGRNGQYLTPQITEIHIDKGYDCKAVTAPVELSETLADELRRITLELAKALNLSGIMDVEVILQDETLYLLEIDARLPSQTPIAVYWSSGINMLELLAAQFVTEGVIGDSSCKQYVRLEHIQVEAGVLTLAGEHLMASSGSLHIEKDFFGVREAVTDYEPDCDKWCATLIHTGVTLSEMQTRRKLALAAIKGGCRIRKVVDSMPESSASLNTGRKEIRHDAAEVC